MTTLKRGVIKAYSASTHKAAVQVGGSLSVWLEDVPVATDIPPAAVVAGRECAVLLFTDDNPTDAVVVTIHGAVPTGVAAGSRIQDADNDTWVDVENAADEDRIRMTVAGVLRALLQTVSPQLQFTGDVDISGRVRVNGATLDYPTAIRVTAGQNLQIRASVDPSGGVMLHATNDNDSAAVPIELRGESVVVSTRLGIGTTPAPGVVFHAKGTDPRFFFEETGQGADQKIWDILIDNAELRFRAVNDANNAAITAFGVFRGSGYTIDSTRFAGNVQLASLTASFGGGAGVVGVANAATVPSSNPSGGGVLYAEAGALKWRGSGGTVTTIAAA